MFFFPGRGLGGGGEEEDSVCNLMPFYYAILPHLFLLCLIFFFGFWGWRILKDSQGFSRILKDF